MVHHILFLKGSRIYMKNEGLPSRLSGLNSFAFSPGNHGLSGQETNRESAFLII